MKKQHKIITVLITAALTFGALWTTLGADQFSKRHRHYYEQHHNCDHEDVETKSEEL